MRRAKAPTGTQSPNRPHIVRKDDKNGKRQKVLLAIGLLVILLQVGTMIVFHSMDSMSADEDHPDEIDRPTVQRKNPVSVIDKSTNKGDSALPGWIANYMTWHAEMRAKYPGKQLFTDPNAPKLIIRICLGICGGINDRLGQLPWDLYLANQTNRLLLISWSRPRALENFLVPTDLDWRIPPEVEGWGFDDMKKVRANTYFFEGMPEAGPGKEFWDKQLDEAIQRATHGKFKDEKILVHRMLGHLNEDVLEARLKASGETDLIHNTLSYGRIFRAFFKPGPGVQAVLDQVDKELNLTPGHYTAVHCRVRHPKARPKGEFVQGKVKGHPADKGGLPFEGANKEFALNTATFAVLCARTLSTDPQEPIYFFADSNDLVQYLVHDLKNPELLAKNASILDNKVDAAAEKAVAPANLVAREMSKENAHIDRQKGRQAPEYYSTFVDLWLAMGARCLTYGIGYYAVFAAKLSGTKCRLLYQEEHWGGSVTKRDHTAICTEDTYKHLLSS